MVCVFGVPGLFDRFLQFFSLICLTNLPFGYQVPEQCGGEWSLCGAECHCGGECSLLFTFTGRDWMSHPFPESKILITQPFDLPTICAMMLRLFHGIAGILFPFASVFALDCLTFGANLSCSLEICVTCLHLLWCRRLMTHTPPCHRLLYRLLRPNLLCVC